MNIIDVKRIREEFDMTQQGFADFLGIDRRTVTNWESGKKIPDSKVKLLELLMEGKRTGLESNIPKVDMKMSAIDLTREIMELKDHIATLKNFLDEKSTILEFYKVENLKMKEEIEVLKNK